MILVLMTIFPIISMNFVEKTQLAAVENTGTESSACMSKQVIEFVSEKKKTEK